MSRKIKTSEAILEALDLKLADDPSTYIMGLGVPDPKGSFGTTLNLHKKYGDRAMDMPTSENGMTGIAIGSALVGQRPIMMHQRIDFLTLAMEQISNQAAKWHYMFGGKMRVPLTIRAVVGRGWGQGTQHSQSLQAWFAHVPGLKVVMPSTPADAKGLLIASIEDDAPTIFIENRWIHNVEDKVPEGLYRTPIGKARITQEGKDATVVSLGYMTLEAMRAAKNLSAMGIDLEVLDLRTLRPYDLPAILTSVRKTGRLIVADTAWLTGGFSGEIVAKVAEEAFDALKCPPKRIALADCAIPSTPALANLCYPNSDDIENAVLAMLGREGETPEREERKIPADIPHGSFTGPF